MESTITVDRDEQRRTLYEKLKDLKREEFRTGIRKVKDDHLLGDLRYDFNWDPDPRKSTWQAIEINRLLSNRKTRRETLPQWIGIAIGNLIALAALLATYFSYREARRVGEFQTRVSYEVSAELVRSLPVEVIAESTPVPAKIIYPDLSDSARLGVLSLWVDIVLTNTGARTFSVEDADAYVVHRSGPNREFARIQTERTFLGAFRTPGELHRFPVAVESGHQHRFLLRVGWLVPEAVSRALKEDLQGSASSLFEAYRLCWARRGVSLANRKPEMPVPGVVNIPPNYDVAICAAVKVAGERTEILRNVLVY